MSRTRLALALLSALALYAPAARADVAIPVAISHFIGVNPVTNVIYARSRDGRSLIAIDGATHAVRTIPLAIPDPNVGGDGWRIDPIHNRVYLLFANDELVVVDGRDLAVESVPATGTAMLADPAADRIWIGSRTAPALAIDGTSLDVTDLGFAATLWSLDPLAHDAYYVDGATYEVAPGTTFRGEPLRVDATSLVPQPLAFPPVVSSPDPANVIFRYGMRSVGVDPWNGRLFHHFDQQPGQVPIVVAIEALPTQAELLVAEVDESFRMLFLDPVRHALWTMRGMFEFCSTSASDVDDLVEIPGTRISGPTCADEQPRAVDLVSNRLYAIGGSIGERLDTFDLDQGTNSSITGPSFGDVVVNAATNRVYVSRYNASGPDVAEMIAPERRPVPITTALWNEPPDANGHVEVHVSATSRFQPSAPPIQQLWTQADAIDGSWSPATPAGAAGTQSFSLAPGAHVVHAFATDGQEAQTTASRLKTMIVGPTTSLPIHVGDTQPAVDIEVKSAFAGETIPRPGAFPFQLSLVNATGGPQTFAFLIALSGPGIGTFYLLPPTGMQIPNGVGFAAAVHLPIGSNLPPGIYTLGGIVFQSGGGIVDQSVTTFTVQ